MEAYYVGLDVHSKQSVFVIENDAANTIARGAGKMLCTPETLRKWVPQRSVTTGSGWA